MKKKLDNIGFLIFFGAVVVAGIVVFNPGLMTTMQAGFQGVTSGDYTMPVIRFIGISALVISFLVIRRIGSTSAAGVTDKTKLAYVPKQYKSALAAGMKLVR